MAKKTIKMRLYTYWEESGNNDVGGNPILTARMAHFGETVDIPRKADVERGEKLDAFFSDKDAKAIEDGTYNGGFAALLREQGVPVSPLGEVSVTPVEDIDVGASSAEDIAEYIKAHNLNVPDTVALAGDSPEHAEKVLDAEVQATDSDPRKGVEAGLERIMSNASQ